MVQDWKRIKIAGAGDYTGESRDGLQSRAGGAIYHCGMAVLCLVHGSAQTSAGWDLLVPHLQRFGHEVLRAELTKGLTDLPARHYAGQILEACGDQRGVVVVGTSMAGLFLPLVAADERVAQTIYIAAIIPKPGTSPMDMVRADPSRFSPAWIGKDPSREPQVARDFLFHDCAPEVQDWALRTISLMRPQRALREPLPLAAWPDKPRAYIVCGGDRTLQPDWCRRSARDPAGGTRGTPRRPLPARVPAKGLGRGAARFLDREG